jgi:hypothetical protein
MSLLSYRGFDTRLGSSGVAFHDVAAAPVVPAHVVTATVVAKDDPAEKIKKLKSLHDQGLLNKSIAPR